MKQKLIIAALVVLAGASITYAAFTQNLIINGTGSTNASWNVAITGITKGAAVGATDKTEPTFTNTSATFDVELAYPGASATYAVNIRNSGTIPAKLAEISGVEQANAVTPSDIKYTLTGVQKDSTLSANGGTSTATIKVEWDINSTSADRASKTATVTLGYVQATN